MAESPIAKRATAGRGGRSSLLAHLAERVRRLRSSRGWSRAELAARAGLSVRFLARVEAADGNISVIRLEALAVALGVFPDEMLRPSRSERNVISLVGLRGAGKSTVGPIVARTLGIRFIELDERITGESGLPLDQLFEMHGERYYRRIEREVLRSILARGEPAVLAVAGGAVNDPTTWELLLDRSVVVWLRATPEDHWNRVVGQGDRRPMADNPDAMDELRAILVARQRYYAQADLTVETSGTEPDTVARQIQDRLGRLQNPARRV